MKLSVFCGFLLLSCSGPNLINHYYKKNLAIKTSLDHRNIKLHFGEKPAELNIEKYFRSYVIHHFNNRLTGSTVELANEIPLKKVAPQDPQLNDDFYIPDKKVDADFSIIFSNFTFTERLNSTEAINSTWMNPNTMQFQSINRTKEYQIILNVTVPYTIWDNKRSSVLSQGHLKFETQKLYLSTDYMKQRHFEQLTYSMVIRILESLEK